MLTEFEDISQAIKDIRSIEDQLWESENKFRGIFLCSPDAIGYCSLDGFILNVNPAFCKLTGYNEEELHVMRYQDITPPEYHAMEAEKLNLVLQGAESVHYEKEYFSKSGCRVPITVTAFIVSSRNRDCVGFAAVIRDTTQIRSLNTSLGQQTKLLSQLLEASADAIIISYDYGKYSIYNEAALAMWGPARPDLEAEERMRVYGLRVPGESSITKERIPLLRALKGENVKGDILEVKNELHPKGLLVSFSSYPIMSEGCACGAVLIARDVTNLIGTPRSNLSSKEPATDATDT